MSVPTSIGRALPYLSYSCAHPFVRAATAAIALGKRGASEQEQLHAVWQTLDDFFCTVQPKSAFELIDYGGFQNVELMNEPPWAVVLPWQRSDIQTQQLVVPQNMRAEAIAAGFSLDIEDGWSWSGPVSRQKLLLESHRILSIVRSIHDKGYQRNDGPDGDVTGILLVSENGQWAWQTVFGQHRAAALAAHGFASLPLRVIGVIRREDSARWFNVKNGLFSAQEAEHIFDALVSGQVPSVASSYAESWPALSR